MSKIFRRLGKTGLVFQLDGESTICLCCFCEPVMKFVEICRTQGSCGVLCLTVTLEKLKVPKSLEPETMVVVLSRGGKKSVLSQEHFIAVSTLHYYKQQQAATKLRHHHHRQV
jgi:hypothetical protein